VAGEELAGSKDNLIKQYPQNFQYISGIAGQIGWLVVNSLPIDYWQKYLAEVMTVDAGKVTDMAKAYLHPDALLIVVMGDRAQVEAGLRGLGLGEIVAIDAAGL